MPRQNTKLKQASTASKPRNPSPASTEQGEAKRPSQTNMAVPPPTSSKPSVSSIVREIWEASDADMPAAYQALFQRVRTDQTLLSEILPSVLMAWCRQQIGAHVGQLRAAALPRSSADMTGHGDRLRVAIAFTMHEFRLPGGKRLGDATPDEAEEGARDFMRTATDAKTKATWLFSAVHVARERQVNTMAAIPNEELETLWSEAEHA